MLLAIEAALHLQGLDKKLFRGRVILGPPQEHREIVDRFGDIGMRFAAAQPTLHGKCAFHDRDRLLEVPSVGYRTR